MSSDKEKPLRGEIMPMARQSVPMVAGTHDLTGPALFVKWRHLAAKKKMDAFSDYLVSAKGAVDAQAALDKAVDDAFEARERAIQRWKDIDHILERQSLEVREELNDFRNLSTKKELLHRQQIALLEEKAIAAERRLAKAKAQTDEGSHGPSTTPEQRAMDRVKVLRKQHVELVKDFVESCGGESSLTEDDRETMRRAELAMRDRINREFEDLRES